ncbi:MAG: DUF5985 family protein [Acidobacteriota bacterium]
MGCAVAGLFYLRFWRETRDRFFLFLTASFWLEAANRFALGALGGSQEHEPLFYLVRFLSYAIIIVAIIDKNRAGRQHL